MEFKRRPLFGDMAVSGHTVSFDSPGRGIVEWVDKGD